MAGYRENLFVEMIERPLVSVTLLVAVVVILGIVFLARRPALSAKSPILVHENWPIVGVIQFWTARFDFFCRQQALSPTGNFSFFLGKNHVVGITSDQGRKVFLESKGLDLNEGYTVLFGSSTSEVQLRDQHGQDSVPGVGFGQYFKERFVQTVRKEKLEQCLPILIADTRARLGELGTITDPFDSIFNLVFLLSMRVVGCEEMARDRKLLNTVCGIYQTMFRSTTATTAVFPWLPTPALIKRYIAGSRMYMILNKIIEQRKTTGRIDDTLQILIDKGDTMQEILKFIVGAVSAAQQNSGIQIPWALVHLAMNPGWVAKVRGEIQAVTNKHFPEDVSTIDKLSNLSHTTWETEFPVIDMCMRDTIRLHLLGSAFRKNVSGQDLEIGGNEVIPNGSFVTFHMSNIHHNPGIYNEPLEWDPARYLPERAEDKKSPLTWLGWGGGRHPCLGMRFAKLEQTVVIAHFLTMFDHSLCDRDGGPMGSYPQESLNNVSSVKPPSPIYFKLKRRSKL